MSNRRRSKYRPRQDDPRMSEPRPYNLDDPAEVDRLHHELQGYMRVSLMDGTDTEGRAHAYAGLCEFNRRRFLAKTARGTDEVGNGN
jgi:hypothetical protein